MAPGVRIDSLDDLVDDIRTAERARVVRAIAAARFAAAGLWQADGATSMAAWLHHHARMSHPEATRLLHEGRFLVKCPAIGDAAAAGVLTAAQVAALRAVVFPAIEPVLDQQQEFLVRTLHPLDLHNTVIACHEWRRQAEALVDPPEPPLPERTLSLASLQDGTTLLRGVLQAGSAAQLRQALDTARTFDGEGDTRNRREQEADAFDTIIEFFNANNAAAGTPRHRPHVDLDLTAADLTHRGGPCATVRDGQLLPSWTTDTLLCDCVVHRVVRAPGTITDYGRATRTVPTNLYRMVIARDECCRFCDRPAAWCDVHHIRPWYPDGETKLDNLLLLCSHHHRMIHRDRWSIQLHHDGSITFTAPDGRHVHRQPRYHATTGPPVAA